MSRNHKFYPSKIYKWHVTPLYEFKEMLLGRRKNEKDNMILVTGARGDGKTTLVGKILFQFEEFDPWESVIYNKEAMFKLIKKKNGYVWADEGVINAAKGNVMSRANKLLFEMSTINRDNYNIVFFLMPFVEDFDTKILQYCSAWIHVDSRGLAVLMLPANKGLFGKKNWDVVYLKKIYDEFIKDSKGEQHVPYWIYPNFRGYIKFGKLPKEQDAIIKEIKALRKNENLDKEMQNEVIVEVKTMENTEKYLAKKLAELINKGELRDMDQFNLQCTDMKLNPEEILKKCDSIFKRNNLGTVKGKLREYKKEDQLLKF
jgi:hypothetical protein